MNTSEWNQFTASAQQALTAIQMGRERIEESQPFKIAVCGAFSTGKTSLINALLGCNLPTGITPVTKVVTRIRYGREIALTLIEPATGERIVITREFANEIILNKKRDTKFREFQLYLELPSPLLAKGIEFWDTPGLQDDSRERLDELSKKAIQDADFCIITFACNVFGNMKEKEFLQELQELSNGNYVCVLNCLNRINSKEQLKDLRDHADLVLRDCGNEYVGRGRYFLVDSDQSSEEIYLDGLDDWLQELYYKKAQRIRKDATLSRVDKIVKPVIEKGEMLFQKLWDEQICCCLSEERKKMQQCHALSSSSSSIEQKLWSTKSGFYNWLDQQFCPILRKRLEAVKANFNAQASGTIGVLIKEFSDELHKTMKAAFDPLEVSNPWDWLSEVNFVWTKSWTSQKSWKEYLSDGVQYGLWEMEVDHTNQSIKETLCDTESRTIPAIKQQTDKYFNSVEKQLITQNSFQILWEKAPEIQRLDEYTEILAKQLMELLGERERLQEETMR